MKYYEFRSRWIPIATPPQTGTRCLVTDGEHITIATYINDGTKIHWMFCEVIAGLFDVIGWMPTPKPMVKMTTVSSTENTG